MAIMLDQIDELMRGLGEEEVMRMLKKQVRKNREIIADLTKQELAIEEEKARKRRREQDREQVRRDYKERWEEEEQRKRKEREKKERRKRIDNEWKRVEEMRIKEERKAKREQRLESMEKIKIDKQKRVIQESKCFGYRGFEHITCYCRNVERRREKGSTLIPSNKFEVFTSRVMNVRILSEDK